MEGVIVALVSANIAFTGLLATLVVRQGARIDELNGRIDTVLAQLATMSERLARLESQRT